jgi:hypothetical protein
MRKGLVFGILVCFTLFGHVLAAVNVQFRGSLDSSVFWTPENAIDGLNKFALYSDVNGAGKNISGYILFGGIDRRGDSLFQDTPVFNMKVSRAWIRISTPIFKDDNRNVIFTIGDLTLNYSPYTLVTGVWGSEVRRGFSFDGLNAGPFAVNGFLFSDQRSSSLSAPTPGVLRVPKLAYGTKLTWQKGSTRISGIGVEYQELNPSWDGKNNSLVFAQPKERDQVVSFELRHKIGILSVNGMYSSWSNEKVDVADINSKEIKQIDLSMPFLSGLTLKAGWKSYEPGFNPRYRDRMPLFVYEEYRGWNPIDRFANQQGYYLEGNLKRAGYDLNLRAEDYVDQINNNQIKKGVLIGGIKEASRELTIKCKNKTTYVNYPHGFTEALDEFGVIVRLNKPFMFAGLPMNRIYYTKIASTETERLNSATGLELKWQLLRGRLSGAKLSIGAEKNSLSYKPWRIYSSFDYTMPGGIWLTWRWASPNLLEATTPEQRWDEDFKEGMIADNYIGLGARITF